MGRKTKSKSGASAVALDPEVQQRIEAKQTQGDNAAGLRKYGEALIAYDEALKDVPERHSLRTQLHGSKAAVFLMDGKYKDAIKECNQGLAIEGNNAKVLFRRARARFEVGLFKDALSDVTKVNGSAEKNDESVAFEKKVRDVLSGNKSGSADVSGPVTAKPNQKQPLTKEQTQQQLKALGTQFVCKVTLEGETKVLHLPYGITYYGLQQAIKEKWTGLHNFKIFYYDRDSDWVLVTCAKDVVKAQHEVLTYAQRHMAYRQRQGLETQPPTWKCKIEKCHRSEVPTVPKEELPKGEERSKVVVKSTDMHAEEMVVELDDWLIDFANLFRDHLGIDPDKHVDVHTEGSEACQRALDTVVKLPEARKLFDESLDRFRDVTCVGLCNWANVHLCLAKKLMENAAETGQKVSDIKKEFEKHCSEAIKRHKEALAYNDQYVEAMLGIGQVHIEEARLAAGVLVPALEGVDSEQYKELNQEELEDLSKVQGRDANAKLKVALEKVTKDDVKKSKHIWDKVYAMFKKAEEAAAGSKSEKTKEREAARADLAVSTPYPDETHLLKNQVKIIWGNALYDQSQMWAGVGLPGWEDMVWDAKARFLSATCKEKDVLEALRNHIRSQDLDLPIEQKPVVTAGGPLLDAAAVVAAAEKPAEKTGAKGLPSLGGKKKKKGGAGKATATA